MLPKNFCYKWLWFGKKHLGFVGLSLYCASIVCGWKVQLLWIFSSAHQIKKYLKGTYYSLVNLLYSNLSCNYYCSLPTTIRYVTTTQCCEICRDQSLFFKVLLWAVFTQNKLRVGQSQISWVFYKYTRSLACTFFKLEKISMNQIPMNH